jgi:N-acetylmuramoyl-L-alanine amidase
VLRFIVVISLSLASLPLLAKVNNVEGVRVWPSPSSTRVVLDLAEPPDYSYFFLKSPDRLVIDLKRTEQHPDYSTFKYSSKLIKTIRSSRPKHKGSARVVIELNQSAKANIFALKPTPPYSNRLVIDFDQGEKKPINQVYINSEQNDTDRDIVVVIDAGHGGEDPGSIGPAGTYEKRITLKISKLLADKINQQEGMKAELTRTGDYFIPVNLRPEIARRKKADLFISIHADAFKTPQPRGGSVWVLSMGRANSELGRWIETTERHSELLGGAAEVIQDTASERYLAEALLDMSMNYSIAGSYDLSENVISEMKKITRMHKRTPQSASLGVLTSPDIPSILVEVGFISNPQEEKNLNWSKFRSQMAQSLFNAISRYFKQYPPDGTLWANWKLNNRSHKVSRGESLSMLAQRYKVSVKQIKQANNLYSDTVRIGQVLVIPRS